jgi:hypothetical protein
VRAQHASRAVGVIAEVLRAVERFCDVGDDAVAPEPDLVAEKPESSEGSCPYRTFGDDAALGAIAPRRCLLDHEPRFRHV